MTSHEALTKARLRRIQRLLEEERTHLQNSIAHLRRESGLADEPERVSQGGSDGQHPADTGTETFEQEKNAGLRDHLEWEIQEVQSALERIERGSYGVCEACGRPIDPNRLDAIPTARYCLADQEAAERRGRHG